MPRPLGRRAASTWHLTRTASRNQALDQAYTEVCRAYERIDEFWAKLLAFLPALSGAGLILIVNAASKLGSDQAADSLQTIAATFGALFTLGLFVYEQRGIQYCIRLIRIGGQLEDAMGVPGRFHDWPEYDV
jgi:hypothetical protein